MWKKNTELTATVVSLGSEGEGVVKTDEGILFVPFCLVGERVRVLVVKANGAVGYGKLLEVLTPSPDRAEPRCRAFPTCGGCALQHMRYEAQLVWKRQVVKEALRKLGGIDAEVEETVACEKPFGYRNKLQLPVGSVGGKTVIGFYAQRSHRIIPIESCPVTEWSDRVIAAVREWMEREKVDGYDETTRRGCVRHVVVREIEDQFIVTIVTATKKLPAAERLVERLSASLGKITLWQNVNGGTGNVVFGKEFHLLYGNGFFSGTENGIVYSAGASTFVQVNADIRKKIYDAALAELPENTVVIDAYAGGGLLTAMIAKKCKRAYGIEIVAEAVECADELKRVNGLENMTNFCAGVEEKLPSLMRELAGEEVVLTVDPPRKGLERSVAQTLCASGVDRIVMISCNPATLARDLGILTGNLVEENGELVKGDGNGPYRIVFVRPFDMFPNTKHVETLVLLERNEK